VHHYVASRFVSLGLYAGSDVIVTIIL